MKITERRIVEQSWYETEWTKTGWDSHGWTFKESGSPMGNTWTVVEHLESDKFGNPYLGVAEREVEIPPSTKPDYEYETFFESKPEDFCKIDGWYPIATDSIRNPEKIEEYIQKGILRRI